MPRLAHSPSPVRPAPPRPSAFGGAREGRVRWRVDLGVGRHRQDARFRHWYHAVPRAPLVRADGVVLTDWNGIVVAHAPGDGARAWQVDLTVEPEGAWHEYWGGLVLVDVEDHVWVETLAGLTRLAPDGAREIVAPNARAGAFTRGVGLPVSEGFVSSVGLDEGWYTRHGPCERGAVSLVDDHGELVREHEEPLCPGPVYVRDDGRIIAFFVDDVAGKREVALELDAGGELVTRHEAAGAREVLEHFRRDVLGDAAPPRVASAPCPRAAVASPGGAVAVDVEWGAAIRLHHERRGPVLDGVSADAPSVGADGRVYVTRVRDDTLWLVGLDAGVGALEVPLVEHADRSMFAIDFGGRPADQWRRTGWFVAPTAIGPDASTLVVTHLAAGRAELVCIE